MTDEEVPGDPNGSGREPAGDGRDSAPTAGGDPRLGDDPRLDDDRVAVLDGAAGTVTLVGVVHEHPASVHRAAVVVDRRDPAVLALELPPLALPLYESHASSDREPPAYGGEMSAAIQAARTDRIVGIDGPSREFLGRLGATLARDRPGRDAVEGVFRGLASATRETLACAAAGAIASRTSLDLAVGQPVDHDCSHHHEPDRQASDEQRQVRRARAVMDAMGPSRAAKLRDEIREAHMADRLRALRREGDVVAVVGYGHLAPLVERLGGDAAE